MWCTADGTIPSCTPCWIVRLEHQASNVIDLPVITTLDIPCERILNKAAMADLKEVMVIGTNQDGSLYFAASFGDGGNVLWLMEKAKAELLKIAGFQ